MRDVKILGSPIVILHFDQKLKCIFIFSLINYLIYDLYIKKNKVIVFKAMTTALTW